MIKRYKTFEEFKAAHPAPEISYRQEKGEVVFELFESGKEIKRVDYSEYERQARINNSESGLDEFGDEQHHADMVLENDAQNVAYMVETEHEKRLLKIWERRYGI